MSLGRRSILGAGLFGLARVPSALAQGPEGYPGSRPVTLVVAWAPGGSTDFVAASSRCSSKELNGNVVVDNRPGASGTIGPPPSRAPGRTATRCCSA